MKQSKLLQFALWIQCSQIGRLIWSSSRMWNALEEMNESNIKSDVVNLSLINAAKKAPGTLTYD